MATTILVVWAEEPTSVEMKNAWAARIAPMTMTAIAWFFLSSLLFLGIAGVGFAIFSPLVTKILVLNDFQKMSSLQSRRQERFTDRVLLLDDFRA